ncbi:MAG: hypothetical protein KAI16_00865 [Candidatus Pacebacteria bacterium]|nr:hypothetical protein [Candidatus Paceibacterota bacterium]
MTRENLERKPSECPEKFLRGFPTEKSSWGEVGGSIEEIPELSLEEIEKNIERMEKVIDEALKNNKDKNVLKISEEEIKLFEYYLFLLKEQKKERTKKIA